MLIKTLLNRMENFKGFVFGPSNFKFRLLRKICWSIRGPVMHQVFGTKLFLEP